MGIYIDIKMPKSCTDCFYAAYCTKCKYASFINNKDIIFMTNSRAEGCPLIEIDYNKLKDK